MKTLVTGSAGHLGEALMRTLRAAGREAIGLDRLPSPFTDRVGSVVDRDFVRDCLAGVGAVVHAATLHKPHVATHAQQAFLDANVTGTLNLLEESAAAGVSAFVFTSTTSAFGDALTPPEGAPAAWVTEEVVPVPKNIYGVSKTAAEGLCELFRRNAGLPCVILRTSRFFPEDDDSEAARAAYAADNLKVNELLYRRVDLQDVVDAHLLALEKAPALGFGRYVISATTPFTRDDLRELRTNAPAVVARRVPGYAAEFARRGWTMLPGIDRVYVNERARAELGWRPRYDFASVVERLRRDEDYRSPLAIAVGAKGYHAPAPHDVDAARAPRDVDAARASHDVNAAHAPHDVNAARAPHDVTPVRAPHDVTPARAPHDVTPARAPHDVTPARDARDARDGNAPRGAHDVNAARDARIGAPRPARVETPRPTRGPHDVNAARDARIDAARPGDPNDDAT